MARNYKQPGDTLTMTSPTGGLKSGDGCLFGSLFGVAQFDALQTEEVEVATEGVWTLKKPSSVISFSEGGLVYWDASESNCTSTAATNYLIGVAARAAGATDPTVDVRLNTPHAAKSFLKALRGVVAVALRVGLCEADPTAGIRVKARTSAHGFRAWNEDDIAQFERYWAVGTRERLAFALLLYSGQRRGDVIRMGRQHVRNGLLMVRQGKTGAVVEIPLHHNLQAILAASGAEHLTFLTTATGKPFAPGAFTNWFGTKCREAGLPLGLSAHGLRKAMCRRLAEAGCSANQIAAISGHATLQEVSRYTKAADQKRMAVTAMGKIEQSAAQSYKPKRLKVTNLTQAIEKER